MKYIWKGFLSLVLSGSIFSASAQQNTYFEQQPVWKIYTQNAHEYPCVKNLTRNQFLGNSVNNDTLTYYPLLERYTMYYSWASDQEPYPFCNGVQTADSLFRGYVRSYGKRVYFRGSFGSPEYLIYDFDLSLGDTLPFNELLHFDTLVVTAIDSVQVSGGNYWKVFSVSGNNYVSQLIEGIGSSSGFLEALEKPYNVNHVLNCYTQNGQKYFPEFADPDCIFFLDVDAHSAMPEAKLFPNPFMEKLWLSVNSDFLNGSFRVFSGDGQVMHSAPITKQQVDIECEKWSQGVYFIECMTESGRISRQKIIKQ
jgi:hypothetical protein